MKKFNNEYFKVITESKVILNSLKPISKKAPDIEQVKEELLKLFKFSTWKEFIDLQEAGQCDFIAKAVCRLFPKFKMVSVYVDYSEEAKEKSNSGYTYATHFLNKLGNTYYDFGKGTNVYDGVYILEGLGNIYDVTLTDQEIKQFKNEMEEDPKAIGTNIR